MAQSITLDDRTLDISDDTARLVAADSLQEAGRDWEAKLLRDLKQPITVTERGSVVKQSVAADAARHGRVARPGGTLRWTEYVGRRRGDLSVAPGDAVRSAKGGGMHLVISITAPRHVSDDEIEDQDAWSSYKDGPGWYGYYDTVPVEEAAAETAEREKQEAAAEAKRAAEEAKKQASTDAWAPVAHLPTVYSLPAALLAGVTWVEVVNDRHLSKFGHGTTRRVGTLPDGTLIGSVSSSQYDDWRDWYHVPESLSGAIEAAKAADAVAADRRKTIESAQKAVDSSIPDSDCSAAGWTIALKDSAVVALAARYVEAGDAQALADYRTLLGRIAVAVTAERTAERTAATAEWLPRITAEFGAEAAAELAASVKTSHDDYAHVVDPAGLFEERLADLRKEKAEAKKAAERKADPMVVVTGNTYPHRAALDKIPGSRLSKSKGGWTWKVPRSQAGRLPKGLDYTE